MGPSDVASRFAIVLRIWVSGTSSYAAPVRSGNGKRETGNVAAAAAVGPADAAGLGARSRSFLTTRPQQRFPLDRKSTRLNSSHGYISYAVFCLKKKKK